MGKIIAYLLKNLVGLVGIVEAVLKAAGMIISLTPTKKDDKVYAVIDGIFTKIKKFLLDASDAQ